MSARESSNEVRSKIKDLGELAQTVEACKRDGKTVVLCHGVFDLLHIGHIRHFQEARKFGDILVVTVTPDRYVHKGPHRPVFGQDLRAEAVAALDCVDYVAINRWPSAVETLRLLRPDVYVKGPDYKDLEADITGAITLEKAAVEAFGGRLAFTDDIRFSSSHLINKYLSVFPEETRDYLAAFGEKHPVEQVIGYLDKARPLRVLVVGEAIIDEYVYCETLGKSGKEPVLAALFVEAERFAGGALAVANHAAGFADRVGVLTCLGALDSYQEFVEKRLAATVEPTFIYMEDTPTIVKRRFVELYPSQKLFELYVMDDRRRGGTWTDLIPARLAELLPRYDVVIVADYGHGMLEGEAVEVLCKSAPFLAVNTQINAGNAGLNTLSKYRRADFICVSEREIRLEARSRYRPSTEVIAEVAKKMSCPRMLVTRGKEGCLAYSEDEGFFQVPAFGVRVVDRVGAGDAVLSVTSLCVAAGAPMEVVGFIGSAAGAEAVATVGNRESLSREPFLKHLDSLLK